MKVGNSLKRASTESVNAIPKKRKLFDYPFEQRTPDCIDYYQEKQTPTRVEQLLRYKPVKVPRPSINIPPYNLRQQDSFIDLTTMSSHLVLL